MTDIAFGHMFYFVFVLSFVAMLYYVKTVTPMELWEYNGPGIMTLNLPHVSIVSKMESTTEEKNVKLNSFK